jgi:hypothetical protein
MLPVGDELEITLAITETSAVAQTVANSGADRLAHAIQGQHGPSSAAATPVENAPKLETPAPSAFGLVLHYDYDMQRLILEARDPVSGFVVLQIPHKYAVEQFSTLRANIPLSGASVNRTV